MSEKQTTLVSALVIVGILAIVGGVFFWKFRGHDSYIVHTKSSSPSSATSDGTVSRLLSQDSTSISLDPKEPSQSSSGSLNVSQANGSDASLGSQPTTQQSPRQNSSSGIPGPESFGQYDQYKDKNEVMFADLSAGNGATAEVNKKVAVTYKGWLTNGTLFDQTKSGDDGRLQPFVFTLGGGQVIKGWDIGVAGMKVGGTRRVIIPPSLGYGPTGVSGVIPANAVLVFDVQLLAVE